MIAQSESEKHYGSARKRFLQASIEQFLTSEFPKFFGPVIRQKMAEKIVELVDAQMPHKDHLRPGQCVWNAVSVQTRPDDPNCRLVPVILTMIDQSDIEELARGTSMTAIGRKAIARLCCEAHQQGALLSMRDIGLLVWRANCYISQMRIAWESQNDAILPHVGTLQDFGSCLTHKAAIIRKVVYEGKDPRRAADETKHTLRAVDRYVKDFHRIRTTYQYRKDMDFVTQVTGLSRDVVRQYVRIIEEHEKTA